MEGAPKKKFFSELEKTILLSLVESNKQVLECKQIDVASTQKKQNAWAELAIVFNSQCGGTKRSAKQLKKLWTNLKSRAKKETGKEHFIISGDQEQQRCSDHSLRVMPLVPSQVAHLENKFEDDAGTVFHVDEMEAIVDQPVSTEDIKHELVITGTDDGCSDGVDCAKPVDFDASVEADQERSLFLDATSSGETTYDNHSWHRLSASQKKVLEWEEKQHDEEINLVMLKKTFLVEEHNLKMKVLRAEAESKKNYFEAKEQREKALHELKLENEEKIKQILQVKLDFWNSNLENIVKRHNI